MPPINTWERKDHSNGTVSLHTIDKERSITINNECLKGAHHWVMQIVYRSGRTTFYWSPSLLTIVRYARKLS